MPSFTISISIWSKRKFKMAPAAMLDLATRASGVLLALMM